MKFVTVLITFGLVGCSAGSDQRTPIAPDPVAASGPTTVPGPAGSTPRLGSLWMMAVEERGSGLCLVGATLEIIRGQRAGERFAQEPCDVWAYGGGFELKELEPGVELTLHFSAPGYAAREVIVVPTPLWVLTATVIGLTKIR